MKTLLYLMPLLWLTACASIPRAVVTVTEVVDVSMKQWATMSNSGQTTREFDIKVMQAHDQYRVAASAAQTALIAYAKSGNEVNYLEALETIKAGAVPLIDLITSIMTTTKAADLKLQLSKASKP